MRKSSSQKKDGQSRPGYHEILRGAESGGQAEFRAKKEIEASGRRSERQPQVSIYRIASLQSRSAAVVADRLAAESHSKQSRAGPRPGTRRPNLFGGEGEPIRRARNIPSLFWLPISVGTLPNIFGNV